MRAISLVTLFLQRVSPLVAVIGRRSWLRQRFPGAAVVAEAPIRRSHKWWPPRCRPGLEGAGPCFEIGKISASKAVAWNRRPSQIHRLDSNEGVCIIAPRRTRIAHLHRPWRATLRFCTILVDFAAADCAASREGQREAFTGGDHGPSMELRNGSNSEVPISFC